MKQKLILFSLIFSFFSLPALTQTIDEDQAGAWYMYFFTKRFKDSQFGIQGDYQFRYWNLGGDLEQLLLRTGLTYQPKNTNVTLTAGYGFIASGQFGESTAKINESRTYLEALMPQKVGERFLFTHRFRYEQRWVENQDFRTRYRYALFLNIPLNGQELKKNVVYVALYNELFINGQKEIGSGNTVQFFDRNRFYTGLGYGLRDNMRIQLGWMEQSTDVLSKGQLQLGLHHNW